MQVLDSFGIIMMPAESVWFRDIESSLFRVNAKSVSESFGIRSVWVSEEFCKSIPNYSEIHSEWVPLTPQGLSVRFSAWFRTFERNSFRMNLTDSVVLKCIPNKSAWIRTYQYVHDSFRSGNAIQKKTGGRIFPWNQFLALPTENRKNSQNKSDRPAKPVFRRLD